MKTRHPIDYSKPVKVYRNLRNGLWSVQQGGLVVAHTSRIVLWDVSYKVSEAGRLRVLRDKQKNVHAFVVGKIVENLATPVYYTCEVTYNPYNSGSFTSVDDGRIIQKSHWVVLDVKATKKVLAYYTA